MPPPSAQIAFGRAQGVTTAASCARELYLRLVEGLRKRRRSERQHSFIPLFFLILFPALASMGIRIA